MEHGFGEETLYLLTGFVDIQLAGQDDSKPDEPNMLANEHPLHGHSAATVHHLPINFIGTRPAYTAALSATN